MAKKLTISLLMLFLILSDVTVTYSQKQGKAQIDSLKNVLDKHTSEDTVKVKLLYTIAFNDHTINPVEGIEYGENALRLAESLDYTNGIIWSLIITGTCYWELPNLPKALEYFIRALEISERMGERQLSAIAYNNIGNVYADQGDADHALQYYLKALATNEQMKSTRRVARNLLNIGTIYNKKKDYGKSLDFYSRALKLYEEINEKRGYAITLLNIGNVYLARDNYDLALDHFNRAIGVATGLEENMTLMNAYGSIGQLYYLLARDSTRGNFEGSPLQHEQKAVYLDKAISYSIMAFRLGKQLGVMEELIGWSKTISDAYMRKKNYELAYRYLDSNRVISDSVFNEKKTKITNSLQTTLEMEQKETEIRIGEVKLEKANVQRIALAAGLLLLVIIAALIYRDRRKSERVLLNILPATIARRLKNRERPIADRFENAAVVFIDIAEFTSFSMHREPDYVVGLLTDFFTSMDTLAGKHGMEKIKTIGDCYMAVCGLPEPVPDSLERTARFALEARDHMRTFRAPDGQQIRVRIGIDTGRVVAGVIGEKKFSYDLWGDVVNTASRMESSGIIGEIQVTGNVFRKLEGKFIMKERGEFEIKGKGLMTTWILEN